MPKHKVTLLALPSRHDLLILDRQLKLKFGALRNDDLINSNNHLFNAISGLIFGSDFARLDFPNPFFLCLSRLGDLCFPRKDNADLEKYHRTWTQGSADVESVQPNFLIRHLTTLLKLEKVQIRNAPWLTGEDVLEILCNCHSLREVDFRDSGKIMRDQALISSGKTAKWEIPWAIKGSRKACAATLPATLASDRVVEVSRERNTEPTSNFA